MSSPDPDCKICDGGGTIDADPDPPHPPSFFRCDCVFRQDVLENVERGLRGLSKAPRLKTSPLLEKEEANLWVTAGDEFQAHLRHLAIRKPFSWSFRVVSDAELVTAWLASIALNGGDILDADAHRISTRFITIPDLVVPPDLLVIRMGIKVARNAASPEVLAEAINTRYHEKKPTWIWDEPHQPLNTGHLFWSDSVGRILKNWEHITDLASSKPQKKKPQKRAPSGNGGRKTLRGGGK